MRRAIVLCSTVLATAFMTWPATAAHNGNNKAELTGTATGTALVNYSEGQGTFNGTTSVSDLTPGIYTFRVTLNGTNPQIICTFEAVGGGSNGCSEQDVSLGGFNRAEIVDASGSVVASGTFARRGNCRDADQGGSQCEANSAPGQQG